MNPELIGPTSLAITQAVGAMNSFLPPLAEVRKKSVDDTEFCGDVRLGELAVVGLTLGIGVIVSSMTGSSMPAVIGFLLSLGIVAMYESVLRANYPLEGKAHA